MSQDRSPSFSASFYSSVPGDHYTVRKFSLSDVETGESREIEHFHYTTWPDFGVPQCPGMMDSAVRGLGCHSI